MSYPVTEIAYLPIKEGISLESGDGKSIWDATLKEIASQKGFKRLLWGAQIETPSVAQMVIDWESLDAHKAFIASEPYKPFLDRLAPIVTGTPHIFHVKLPDPTSEVGGSPFDAPVTESVSLYFNSTLDEASYNKSFSNFVAEAVKVPGSEATGIAGCWGVETHKFEGEGDDKKFFGTFIGWPSVQSHMDFRAKEEFPRVAGHLREGVEKAKMHHVALKKFEA